MTSGGEALGAFNVVVILPHYRAIGDIDRQQVLWCIGEPLYHFSLDDYNG